MTTQQPIDLDALANPARFPLVSLGGVQHPVRPISNGAAHRIAVAHEGDSASAIVAAMQAAARESVPTLADVFDTLTLEQVTAIVAIARGGADAVEALIAERHAGK